MKNTLVSSIPRPDLRGTAAQCGLFDGQIAHLLVKVSENAVFPGNVILSNATTLGEIVIRCRRRIRDLPRSRESYQVDIRAPII